MPEADPDDALLERALRATPAVLAVAGLPERTAMSLRAPPFLIDGAPDAQGELPRVERFTGALTNVEQLNRAASGWGLISADPTAGVLRRVPLVAQVNGTLIGAMAIEMFRVAAGIGTLRLVVDGTDVHGIAIGNAFVPTERDGGARVYFSPRRGPLRLGAGRASRPRRSRPASGKLVLIAVTGLGLADYHYTPVGERMPGSEIHAQLIENLYEDSLLSRPAWARWLEAVLAALVGALLVWATPRWKPRNAVLLPLACIGVLALAAFAAFALRHLLFDVASATIALLLLFGTLLALTLAEAARHRRALELVAHRERVRTILPASWMPPAASRWPRFPARSRFAITGSTSPRPCRRPARSAAICTTSSASITGGCSCWSAT